MYKDAGISAKDMEHRPAFQQMLEDIKNVTNIRQKYRNKLRNCTDDNLIKEYKTKRDECTNVLNI